jgi:hypothetical protein
MSVKTALLDVEEPSSSGRRRVPLAVRTLIRTCYVGVMAAPAADL